MINEGIGAILELNAGRARECVKRAITLLDRVIGELGRDHSAKGTILQAASILREQINPQAATAGTDRGTRMLAWQARRVREHIDAHIAGPIRVADLSALIRLSDAHFSRSFKHAFGVSPHAFVIQRRLELAAQYMLETDACLSDIALRCGFTDQPHLCKHFRVATGQSPAAWRRARRSLEIGNAAATVLSYRNPIASARATA